jgi:peroxiredoxin
MKTLTALFLCLAGILAPAFGGVVRTAPDFSFPAPGSKNATLKSLRGRSVVLVIGDSAGNRAFKKQVRYLGEIYTEFAGKKVLFIAALKDTQAPIRSDIPFVLANNGAAVGAAYGAEAPFTLVVIGKDGNIDYQTTKVCTGERVRDVVQNSFVVQNQARP